MRCLVPSVALLVLMVSYGNAQAGLVLSGGGLVLAEQGGTFDAANLAVEGGAAAFSLDQLDFGVHFTVNLNNGSYGNSSSWIGGGATGTSGPFVGISLGGTKSVQSIAFGRDNGGEATSFVDRWAGLYTLQYTTVANPNAATVDADWTTIGTLDYQSAGGGGFHQPWLRHRYNFDPVTATAVRLIVPATGLGAGTAIDEIELYSSPGTVLSYPVMVLTPAVGFGIGYNGNEGDHFDPAAPPDQAGAPDNAALATNGATAFGSTAYPAPAHTIDHANDGYYGNSNSWLSDPADQAPFIGIDLSGRTPLPIQSIAFGRDNGNSNPPGNDPGVGGVLVDRWQGLYTLQYTLLPDPNALTLDTDDPLTGWADIGTIELVRQGDAGESLQQPWLRHEYSVMHDAGPVWATGIRILCPYQNAIDEIEIHLVPEPSSLLLLAVGGLVAGLCFGRRRHREG